MNYSDMSTNEQRLQIAAYGYEKRVVPDYYDVRAAMEMQDIAADAYRGGDPAKATLLFAVFLKATKMAGLTPRHILKWIARTWGGQEVIADYASAELGMVKAGTAWKEA